MTPERVAYHREYRQSARGREAKRRFNASEKGLQSRQRHDAKRTATASWRNGYLRAVFGLQSGEYDKLLAFQGGGCALCGVTGKTRRLPVDHRHKDGLTRGILCYRHNRGLGFFRDDADLLQRAVDYIRQPPATVALGREVYGRKGPVRKRLRGA